MSLVPVAVLAARLGVSSSTPKLQGSLDAAEASVAAYLGASTLARVARSEIFLPRRDRATVEISAGPLAALAEVLIAEEPATLSDLKTMWWGFAWKDPARLFAAGRSVTISYLSGWVDHTTMPGPIVEAILQTARVVQEADASGRLKASESIGDFSVSWEASAAALLSQGLPSNITILLAEYRRPFGVA